MPGIHPASRKQVRWAFAAESRGQFPKGKAREWAHNWKCWTWKSAPVPKECAGAMKILETVRQQHPTWKVPGEVLAAEELRRKVTALPPRPARPAARPARPARPAAMTYRPPVAAYTAKAKKPKKRKATGIGYEDPGEAAIRRIMAFAKKVGRQVA